MKKWLGLISIILIANIFGFLVFILNSIPAQAGVPISVTVSVCGNSTIDGTEQCDGSNLNGETCVSRGYTGGSLSCKSNCAFNVSSCTSGGGGGGSSGGGGGGTYVSPTATKAVLQGKASPGAKITILIDGKVATIIAADSLANFKSELTALSAGVYTFGLWSEDKEGRKSITFSFTVTVTADTTTTISGIFIPPTIDLEKTSLSKGEVLNILGQTAPESEITISVQSEEITKTTKADKQGNWKYSFDISSLDEGSHNARAKAKTAEGLLSSYSKVLGFSIGKYSIKEISPQADFNKDGKANLTDFSIMLYWWGKYNPSVDQNQDGVVNLTDFSILMYNWTG